MNRLIHDCAWVGAWEIVKLFANALRPEEQRDAHEEAYRVLMATLEAYQIQVNKMRSRLDPLCN